MSRFHATKCSAHEQQWRQRLTTTRSLYKVTQQLWPIMGVSEAKTAGLNVWCFRWSRETLRPCSSALWSLRMVVQLGHEEWKKKIQSFYFAYKAYVTHHLGNCAMNHSNLNQMDCGLDGKNVIKQLTSSFLPLLPAVPLPSYSVSKTLPSPVLKNSNNSSYANVLKLIN